MTKLFPYPLASVGLLALWLLLNQTVSLGQFIIGVTIALVGGWILYAMKLENARPKKLGAILCLAAVVVADIVRSNIAVARIILGSRDKPRTSGFVEIPLELSNSYGLATLACIITSTPGTLWVAFDSASGILTIHVLDLVDQSEWVRIIKQRYERRLLEIFA
ncbi:Na+/H+ antiporter subunit E [Rhodoplanes sp. Z2-YC6860]|uniref:Na+/H+ antiporter subunit E n=1 Tax=Rhodoplanes sp. Z2-YC6860 TaxID=674703 RepID=UPI00078B59CA|nr:Na+/H+ antiporter subunit E [Rhodoplanes sp. Z2-YC6860]AMN44121.1 monovalent cation/H+ antiporter subunit E [Rhodoplanes sp. Z2-YC6860]